MQTATIAENHYSLADFQQNLSELINRIRETGQPLMLTVDDKVEAVVLDAESYRILIEALDYADAVEGIRRGLESMKNGEGQPSEEFLAEMRRKFNIPDKQ